MSLEDFKREPKTKTKDSILSSIQICENIHYFYYDLKGSFINQLSGRFGFDSARIP